MGRIFKHIDWISAFLIICLSSFGLFLLLTISHALFFQQLFYIALALILLIVLSGLDSAMLWWAAPFGYIGSLIFLVLAYLGPAIRGAQRWIIVGPAQLQPSEIVKPLIFLVFGSRRRITSSEDS